METKEDLVVRCDDCGQIIGGDIIGIVTEKDDYLCQDCADGREAQWLNMIEDDYYDCRGLN